MQFGNQKTTYNRIKHNSVNEVENFISAKTSIRFEISTSNLCAGNGPFVQGMQRIRNMIMNRSRTRGKRSYAEIEPLARKQVYNNELVTLGPQM